LIQLRRPPGGFARVGHRGASALAPENTLPALALAVELGCDMLEFDVLDLVDGTLVLAHSTRLKELTQGEARGRVRRRGLDGLRQVAPNVPTLDEALAYCAAELPETALQLDLKRRGIERAVVAALHRHGVLERSWVSGFDAGALRRIADLEPALPRAYTLPRDRLGISKRGPLAPVVRGGLAAVGASLPRRLPEILRRHGVQAATLHHSVCSEAAIAGAHGVGAAVYVWTVDEPVLAQRLIDWGADGIITNDPRIFATLTT
jgi:glycerophosphoryl diester phosphodiesterase